MITVRVLVADWVAEEIAERTEIGEVDDEFVVLDWLTDSGVWGVAAALG